MTKMEYCVGHGLFVRWSFLRQVGLFPSPIEDTRLGHVASYLGERIRLLPVFDTVEVAVGVRRQIQQTSVWFTGEALFADDLHIARIVSTVPTIRAARLMVYKLYRNAVWIVRPFFLAAAVTVTACGGHGVWAVLTLSAYLYLPILALWATQGQLKNFTTGHEKIDSVGSFMASLLFAPAEFLTMSLGPLLGLIRFAEFRMNIEELNLKKTERPKYE
jgi:hypothetical protein